MAWKDKTAPGGDFDKEKLTNESTYTLNDYVPRLDLGGKVFKINKINCGWDRFNKRFRPIKEVPTSDYNLVGWDWDKSISMDALLTDGKDFLLPELIEIHHNIRRIQDNNDTNNQTTGILDLMKWMEYKFQTPDSLRVFLSNQNKVIISVYNRNCGKPAFADETERGWFGKDFPNEFNSVKENKEIKYEYKLLKGLYLHTDYRKPTKHRSQTKDPLNQDAQDSIMAMLTLS